MREKSGKGAVVKVVEEVGLRVKLIAYSKDFPNALIGGGGKPSEGGVLNSKSNSNAGGKMVSSSGVRPAYSGGRYYGEGATVPYTTGQRSPLGLVPLLILPIAALAIFPGLWLYGVYQYPYTHPYTFVNETITNITFPNGINQTLSVDCLCQRYSVCGCDDVEPDS